MKNAIAVCGQICSGKSSIIKRLSKLYHWDVISFGDYIRHLAVTNELPLTRKTYQELGQSVLAEQGPHRFLHTVIQFNQPTSPTHLFDGVRHASIANCLRQIYARALIVYLDVSDEHRYRRFQVRARQGDPVLSYKDFLALSEQPIECGISSIANIADLRIDATISLDALVAEFVGVLIENGFVED